MQFEDIPTVSTPNTVRSQQNPSTSNDITREIIQNHQMNSQQQQQALPPQQQQPSTSNHHSQLTAVPSQSQRTSTQVASRPTSIQPRLAADSMQQQQSPKMFNFEDDDDEEELYVPEPPPDFAEIKWSKTQKGGPLACVGGYW